MGRGASGVAAGHGAVWVVNTLDGTLSRVDPRTRRVVATVDVGPAPRAVAVATRLGLGDRACVLGAPSPSWPRRPWRSTSGCGDAEPPLRIGVVVDCVGINRSLHDAELSGARCR